MSHYIVLLEVTLQFQAQIHVLLIYKKKKTFLRLLFNRIILFYVLGYM